MSGSGSNTPSYFTRNYPQFDVLGGQDSGSGLRECQLGAYYAVMAHFTTSDEPALVSLPTGSGKTALMMALSFGLKSKRVLIITPAEVLSDQTKNEFESLRVLKSIKVLCDDIKSPKVLSNGTQLRTKQQWHDLERYNVVTATPKTTSPAEIRCNPPEGIFDLVFLDEAHHTPAPTWAEILKAFKGAKCVLLTATPFRRDRHRIQAPLVYHYSIGRALEKGIYRPVEFHAVESGSKPTESDEALCLAAKQVLSREKNLKNKSKLLIRANRVDWSNRLVKLYKEHGINVEAVNYEKPWEENKATIEAVRNDQLDGLVCVGMIGEGLDLPALKIAVLHSAPKSLPFTLQFVGRISRMTKTQVGNAHLIAIPDDVRGEMRKLYRSDVDWKKLVPKLADRVIAKTPPPVHMSSRYAFEEWDISPWDLKPFFSVRVYAVDPKKVDLGRRIELPEGVGICFHDLVDNNLCAIITELDNQPPWAKDTEIREARLDLHVFIITIKPSCFSSRRLPTSSPKRSAKVSSTGNH
jgi:superfamily II DNA or RNA helicase